MKFIKKADKQKQQEGKQSSPIKLKRKEKSNNSIKQTTAAHTKPEGIDFVSPSSIKETIPTDETIHGKANDYLVEVGGTNEPVRYFRSFFAELTGGNTYATMLDPLLLGEFGEGDADVAVHIEPVDTTEELEDIARRIRAIESDLYREKNDQTREKLKDELFDLKERQKRLRTNVEKPFRVAIQAVASATNLQTLKKFTNNMIRRFAGREIILRSPDGKQLDALLNITPLGANPLYKEHTHSYESSNVADFFPFGNGKVSHTDGIVWGTDHLNRPVFYNGWYHRLMNHNIVIFGRSGGGKTFSSQALIHRDTIRGIRHAIINPKGDYRVFVKAMGCPYIDLSLESDARINFFDVDIEELENGEKRVNLEGTVQAARAIVFKMLRIMDEQVLNGRIKVRIENKIRELYKERGIASDPASLIDHSKPRTEEGKFTFNQGRKHKDMPTLGDLYLKLVNDSETTEIAELLKNFTKHGDAPSQSFFDTQSTVRISDVPMFAFGLDRLDEEIMRPLGLFIATKWQSTKFAKKNRQQKKRVIVDEAQIPMQDDETAQWLENEFRVVRFFNTSMCAITQGFEVFLRSPYGMGILKNAPTKLFMKQDPIDIAEVQGKFDLTEWEADFLVNTAEKGLGIIRIDEESSQIYIDSSGYEYQLFTTDPNDAVGAV